MWVCLVRSVVNALLGRPSRFPLPKCTCTLPFQTRRWQDQEHNACVQQLVFLTLGRVRFLGVPALLHLAVSSLVVVVALLVASVVRACLLWSDRVSCRSYLSCCLFECSSIGRAGPRPGQAWLGRAPVREGRRSRAARPTRQTRPARPGCDRARHTCSEWRGCEDCPCKYQGSKHDQQHEEHVVAAFRGLLALPSSLPSWASWSRRSCWSCWCRWSCGTGWSGSSLLPYLRGIRTPFPSPRHVCLALPRKKMVRPRAVKAIICYYSSCWSCSVPWCSW